MKIPNTDQFDRKFQVLLSAGEELAGIKAVIDIQLLRMDDMADTRQEQARVMLDYLYEQKRNVWDDISCRLAGLEELIK